MLCREPSAMTKPLRTGTEPIVATRVTWAGIVTLRPAMSVTVRGPLAVAAAAGAVVAAGAGGPPAGGATPQAVSSRNTSSVRTRTPANPRITYLFPPFDGSDDAR